MSNVTVFYIQSGEFYLAYNQWDGVFYQTAEKTQRAEFMEEERAVEVAQFHNKSAAYGASEKAFEVFKESATVTKIKLPKVDWLKDHKVEVEGADDHGAEIEE